MTKKYALITGASYGIGAASAKKLAANSWNLILVARRTEKLQTVKKEILAAYPELDVVILTQDLANIDELPTFYHNIAKQYDVKIWDNNAGFDRTGDVTSLDFETVKGMINTNSTATAILSTLYAKDHEQDNAQLINVGSMVGYKIWPGDILYSATKHFVTAFTEGLADEMKKKNAKLQVKLLSPFVTQSGFEKIALGHDVDYAKEGIKHNTSEEMAENLLKLIQSDKTVGFVNNEFNFELLNYKLMK